MTNQALTTVIPSPGGGEVYRCNECRGKAGSSPAYPRTEADIRHRATCSRFRVAIETPVTVTSAQAEAVRQGGASNCGLTDDEIVVAVNTGKISADDAMNRDY